MYHKKILSLVTFVTCLLMLPASVWAETYTMSTYYPAPNGRYQAIDVSTLKVTPTTAGDVDAAYGCTNGVGADCAGIMWFDGATFWVSNGTDGWAQFASTVTATAPLDIGGYKVTSWVTTAAEEATALSTIGISHTTTSSIVNLSDTSPNGVNLKYGPTGTAHVAMSGTGNVNMRINFINFPKASYSFTWSGDVWLDEYVEVTASTPTMSLADKAEFLDYLTNVINSAALSATVKLQAYDGVSTWYTWDTAIFTDTADPINSGVVTGVPWSNAAMYYEEPISRSSQTSSSAHASNYWGTYRLIVAKTAKSVVTKLLWTAPTSGTVYSQVKYQSRLKVRIDNFQLLTTMNN